MGAGLVTEGRRHWDSEEAEEPGVDTLRLSRDRLSRCDGCGER